MEEEVYRQIKEAYQAMVKAGYRPAMSALADLENIPVTIKEIKEYARNWLKEEDQLNFLIGCCDDPTRKATIYAVEAARLMCGGVFGHPYARKLLEMAIEECKQFEKENARTIQLLGV